ncbi:GspH/FimT family pseudopilin [Vibrio makurazakiensis]|uniref:GspH/FimT family pseudopilin n=1 Tax=Vibrio makurazakiensis TaxID=2910250 RepID=UPI003D0C4D83
MTRGFTLLELLITVAVLAVLLATAAPSFSSLAQTTQMQRLATEINGFMIQAKSEAVMRNQDLWAHFVMVGNQNSSGEWKIELKTSDVANVGPSLLTMQGEAFKNINLIVNYSSEQIKFSGVNGKAKDGNLKFSVGNKVLTLITYRSSGRMRICGVGGAYYGYDECS